MKKIMSFVAFFLVLWVQVAFAGREADGKYHIDKLGTNPVGYEVTPENNWADRTVQMHALDLSFLEVELVEKNEFKAGPEPIKITRGMEFERMTAGNRRIIENVVYDGDVDEPAFLYILETEVERDGKPWKKVTRLYHIHVCGNWARKTEWIPVEEATPVVEPVPVEPPVLKKRRPCNVCGDKGRSSNLLVVPQEGREILFVPTRR